jgi:hypothetical protein
MYRSILAGIVVCAIGVSAAQTRTISELTVGQPQFANSTGAADAEAFAGKWQGLWQRYRAATHTEKGSQTSLFVNVAVKQARNGVLSGTVSTSDFERQPTSGPNPLPLGAPPHPVAAPPPPLPAVPPSGKLLNPRVEGRALLFQVKDSEGKLVDFRLALHGPDGGTLNATRYARLYPEFDMKRVH